MTRSINWGQTVAAIVAAVIAAGVVYYFISAPQRAREANAKAEAGQVMSDAAQGAARDTITHIDHYINRTDTITRRTEETNREIANTPGADQLISPELDRAGRIALCMHDNRDDAECRNLLPGHDGGSEPTGPDAARSPSG